MKSECFLLQLKYSSLKPALIFTAPNNSIENSMDSFFPNGFCFLSLEFNFKLFFFVDFFSVFLQMLLLLTQFGNGLKILLTAVFYFNFSFYSNGNRNQCGMWFFKKAQKRIIHQVECIK